MRRGIALLAAGALALSVSIATSNDASALPPPRINDEAILGIEQLDGEVREMPRTLAEYGFFLDAAARSPAPGLIPYELNTPLWSDGADKLRYIYLPEGEMLDTDGDLDNPGLLQFPVGSAIIKTFAFGERYVETRVLVHRADGWVALPYRWNQEQTEARLALAGARIPITTPSGEEISYRIPNKNQCKSCHSKDGEIVPIGPKVRNLSFRWLTRMALDGHIKNILVKDPIEGPLPVGGSRMPEWNDEDASTEVLARAYLDVNCAHCHQPGGGASNSGLDLRWEQSDRFAIGVNKPPVAAGRGAGGLLVSIEPGAPERSILVHRMDSNDPGVAMPELGRSTIDRKAVALMRKWISEMGE